MLGAQCLSCRKRRVRCDSRKPDCGPCLKKHIVCPGYERPLLWVNRGVGTFSQHKAGPSRRPALASQQQRAQLCSEQLAECSSVVQQRAPSWPSVMPLPLAPYLEDYEALQLFQAVMYFNGVVAPTLTPDPTWLPVHQISAEEWRRGSDLSRDMVVVLAAQHKAINSRMDPDKQLAICKYRDRAVRSLNSCLADAATQLSDDTLDSVMMLVMVELQSYPSSNWYVHLQGAATIVRLRGGWKAYLEQANEFALPVEIPIMIDVMSGTTCASQQLSPPAFSPSWTDYLGLEPYWEEFAKMAWAPVPWKLFASIIRINGMREKMPACLRPEGRPMDAHELEAYGRSVCGILRHISSYSPEVWVAQNIRSVGAQVLQDWITLLHCFRYATLLYCLRTLVFDPQAYAGRQQPFGLPKPMFGSTDPEAVRAKALRELLARLGLPLENTAPPAKLPPKSSGWNGIFWPLFIAGYEADAEGLFDELPIVRSFVSSKLKELAVTLGTRSFFDAEILLKRVWAQRDLGIGEGWTWDETFKERYVFL